MNQPEAGQWFQVLEDGRYAFYFDAHTLQTFSQCEQMFYLKNVLFAPQTLHLKGPQRACISIGSWWSRVSELFYKQMSTSNNNVSIFDMIAIAGKAWVESDMDEMEKTQPEKYEKFAIPIRAAELGKYFTDASVTPFFEFLYTAKAEEYRRNGNDEKAREIESRTCLPLGPLLMAAQYYQNFYVQDARDWRVICAEAPFGRHGEVVIGETDKVVVYWQGKPDLVVWEEKTGVLAPLDQKTKDYIPYNVNTIWKPHNQMAGYIYAIQCIAKDLGFAEINVDRCIVSVCGRLKPAEPRKKGDAPKPRFVRVRPTFTRDEIEEWRLGILKKAERMRYCLIENVIGHGDTFTRNESACHIWSGCEYRGICSRPAGVRPLIIQSDYIVQDAWTPFDSEED